MLISCKQTVLYIHVQTNCVDIHIYSIAVLIFTCTCVHKLCQGYFIEISKRGGGGKNSGYHQQNKN